MKKGENVNEKKRNYRRGIDEVDALDCFFYFSFAGCLVFG